ncbi:hypothetical protein MTO96_031799 [Rhipicephalus appendiculatus]
MCSRNGKHRRSCCAIEACCLHQSRVSSSGQATNVQAGSGDCTLSAGLASWLARKPDTSKKAPAFVFRVFAFSLSSQTRVRDVCGMVPSPRTCRAGELMLQPVSSARTGGSCFCHGQVVSVLPRVVALGQAVKN